MAGLVAYEQSFSSTAAIVVTHSLDEISLDYRVVIGGEARPDLVLATDLTPGDQANEFTITLASSQTGVVQVFRSGLLSLGATIPFKNHDGAPFAYHMGTDNIKLDEIKDAGDNWAVTVGALKVESPKPIKTFAFDDTTEEGIGTKNPFYIPAKTTGFRYKVLHHASSAPGGTRKVGFKWYVQIFADGAAVTPSWSAGFLVADLDIPAANTWVVSEGLVKLSDLGLSAGEFTRLQVTRVGPSAGTNLSGDWTLYAIPFELTQEAIP